MNLKPNAFWSALLEGTIWSLLAVAVCGLVISSQGGFEDWVQEAPHEGLWVSGIATADFGRRWEGGCPGWQRAEAVRHLLGNLLHWWSYCTIAFVFWRLHPPLATVPYSTITLTLVGWFILGCGVSHLLAATTMFWPAYRIEGLWLLTNGVVSAVSTVFVAFSLTRAFEVVYQHRANVLSMKKELADLKKGR